MTEAFFLAGFAANACVRDEADLVSVPSADALFQKTALQDGHLWNPFRLGALDTDPSIEFDTNKIFNGDFEDSADGVLPSGWATESGTPTTSTDQADGGTKSLKLDAADEGARQDVELQAGSTHRISAALWGDGTNVVNAYVIDLVSGKYLLSNGTWSTTKTAWASRTTASFATSAMTLTLEDPPQGHVGPVLVRILFERPGTIAGAAYVDSVALWPKVTVAALVYDTIPTAFTITVESADDAAFTSNVNSQGTMPAQRFRKFLIFAGPATPQRYWRFRVTGTPFIRPWISQTVLGERVTMTRAPNQAFPTVRQINQEGTESFPANLSTAPQFAIRGEWRTTDTGMRQASERLVGGSRHGSEPVLFVPDSDNTDEFVYAIGRIGRLESVRETVGVHDFSLDLVDDLLPVQTK